MAQSASVKPDVGGGGNVERDVCATLADGIDSGRNGVLARNIRTQQRSAGDLKRKSVRGFIDRDIGAQRAGLQNGKRINGCIVHRPGHVRDVRRWNGDIDLRFEIDWRADANGG